MYSRSEAKARGRKLRAILSDLGHDISHTHALEAVARCQGYRDWNTCAVMLDQRSNLLPIPKGWFSSGDRESYYDVGLDGSTTYKGHHPALIRQKEASSSYVSGFATLMQHFKATRYAGKRLQLSAMMKSEDIDGCAALWLRADEGNQTLILDNTEARGIGSNYGPLVGTNDWSKRIVILDTPKSATKIAFGFYGKGRGSGYASDFKLAVVSNKVPVTFEHMVSIDKPYNLSMST